MALEHEMLLLSLFPLLSLNALLVFQRLNAPSQAGDVVVSKDKDRCKVLRERLVLEEDNLVQSQTD